MLVGSPTSTTCSATDPTEPSGPSTTHRLELLSDKKESNCYVCSTPARRRHTRHWCPICQVGVHEKCEKQFTHRGYIHRRGTKRTMDNQWLHVSYSFISIYFYAKKKAFLLVELIKSNRKKNQSDLLFCLFFCFFVFRMSTHQLISDTLFQS